MRFYFFQSKCVVIVSSPCDFPTREGLYSAKGPTKFVRVWEVLWSAIHSTKIPTAPTGKSGQPQKVDQFLRNFSSWTEPIHWVLDRNFGRMDRARYVEVLFQLYRGLRYIEVHYIVVPLVWVWVMFVSSFCRRLVKVKEVWSVFSVESLENFIEARSIFETFLGQRVCWRAKEPGTRMKAQVSCPSKAFEEGWRGSDTMIFELLR